ncbi:hypothetical protein BSLG_001869 [Batrachochytrium salamandrivorans]|nr:hypothetical protein BSLG_001869 [Batrachochytrium salamandrivorans]
MTAYVGVDPNELTYSNSSNPFLSFSQLHESLNTSTDAEFQQGMFTAFDMLHDQQAKFTVAGPYSCFLATTGVSFRTVENATSKANTTTVVVSTLTKNPQLLNLFGPNYSRMSIGDELYKVDGLPLEEWFMKRNLTRPTNSSSPTTTNDAGSRHDALSYLYAAAYKSYMRTMTSHSVLNKMNMYESSLAQTNHTMKELQLNTTNSSFIHWGVWKPLSKNLGVIQLDTFEPQVTNTTTDPILAAIHTLRNLLTNELKDTNSVVLDVRGNPGGLYYFASLIPQLFAADVAPMNVRYQINPSTQRLFVDGSDPQDPLHMAWSSTLPGSRYTDPFELLSSKQVNTIGQAYLGPMGVLINGGCYAECEMFAALVQDTSMGTVFGEAHRSGGSSSSPFRLDTNQLSDDPLSAAAVLAKANLTGVTALDSLGIYNRFNIPTLQLVRSGMYAGQLIEEVGVKPDVLVHPRLLDLLSNGTEDSQLDRIADHLEATASTRRQTKQYFLSEPFEYEISTTEGVTLNASVSGIDSITVLAPNGGVLAVSYLNETSEHMNQTSKHLNQTSEHMNQTSKHLNQTSEHMNQTSEHYAVSLPVVASSFNKLGNTQLVVLGSSNATQVIKTYRQVRVVPPVAKYFNLTAANHTLSVAPSAYVGVYNAPTTPTVYGWGVYNGTWTMGAEHTNYTAHADTAIESFFTAPVGSKLGVSVNLTLSNPNERQYVSLAVMDSNGRTMLLMHGDDTREMDDHHGWAPASTSAGSTRLEGEFSLYTDSARFSVVLRAAFGYGGHLGLMLHAMQVTLA